MTRNNDRLSVMQIILTLEMAGAQEVVRTLAEQLQANGCNVVVCSFHDGPMRAEIEKLGIKVEILSRPRYKIIFLPMFMIEMLRIRRDLARLIATYQVDVAQTHILQVLDFLVLTLRFDTNLRVVLWTMQNVEFLPEWMPNQKYWFQKIRRWVYLLLYRLLARWVDGFIAVSDEVRQSIIMQVGPIQDEVFTICNAVDLKLFEKTGDKAALCEQLGIEAHSNLVAVVGRLTEQKGHCYLIDAASDIVSACPNTHFLFIGDGELRDQLQGQAKQAGVSKNIHFLGVRKDVPELLADADLFVLSSLWEGLSVALLEAMAAGKPIVASSISGTIQAVTHNQTGLLVPPRDSRALAEATVQLLSDPAKAWEMGQAAKQYVEENFSAKKQVDEHLALYHQLLSGNES